ncbi:TldD/PmbA family protein [Streptomyces sp. NPDC005406]|uniref:TldD/PmbA family protein n=1 Tax=Streptomyces sp. NPDC005406 TaxID=3155339 RepID=UPI0034517FD5
MTAPTGRAPDVGAEPESSFDRLLEAVAAHWCEEGVRLGAQYAQAFVEATSNVRLDSTVRHGARAGHGTSLDRRFGVGLLLRRRDSWWYGSAPLAEPGLLAERVAALQGFGRPRAPEPISRCSELEEERPHRDLYLLTDSITRSAAAADLSVDFVQDFFRGQRAVVDSTGAGRTWRSTGGRQRCAATAWGQGQQARVFTRRNAPHWRLGDAGPDLALSAENLILSAADRSRALLGSRRLGVRTTPVVLAPRVGAALLHELIGHALEADNLAKASSYTSGLMGAALTSAPLRLVDDPGVPEGMGSCATDDDGQAATRVVLVDQGIVAGRLTCTRAVYGSCDLSTGSGRREDYRHASLPRASNTVVLPGPDSTAALLKPPRGGLLHVGALSSGEINLDRGEFSFAASESHFLTPAGDRIPLQDVVLFGDARDALRQLAGIADDVEGDNATCGKQGQSVRIGLHSPTMRFEQLTWRC